MSNNQEETGVVINGVRWATRNVGAPGTFVENPEDYGGYYTWEEAKSAFLCPKGWRLPTVQEINSLCDMDSKLEKLNAVRGRVFGNEPYRIFLPRAGYLKNETLFDIGGSGFYRSDTQRDTARTGKWILRFNHNKCQSEERYTPSYGYSVRCVAEDSQLQSPMSELKTETLLRELLAREVSIRSMLTEQQYDDIADEVWADMDEIEGIQCLLGLNHLSTYEDICEELKKLMR